MSIIFMWLSSKVQPLRVNIMQRTAQKFQNIVNICLDWSQHDNFLVKDWGPSRTSPLYQQSEQIDCKMPETPTKEPALILDNG